MAVTISKDAVFKCSVDAILHPKMEDEAKRTDKSEELWTIFRTYIKKGNNYEARLCCGMAPHIDVGDELTLTGDLVDDEKWGMQFKFNGIQKQIPTERNGLISFFSKNINGVGFVMAEKIVDILGADAVEKIENDYTILNTISGISEKKAISIYNQICSMHSSVDELKFFARTGLGTSRIAAVKSFYASLAKESKKAINIIDLIKENPYRLVDDVKGIGFKVADKVAINIGIPKDDVNRIAAGLKFALKDEVETKGNIWSVKEELITTTASKDYLNISNLLVKPVLEDSVVKGELVEENGRIYLPTYHKLELDIADKIHQMQKYAFIPLSDDDINKGIEEAEGEKGRTLDDGQKTAVSTCVNANVSVVTGGPGTGKTTTLDTMLYILEKYCNMEVTMMAPTGKAAKRMTEQTGRNAATIHSYSMKKSSADFKESKKRHVIVIDESSMVDTNVMKMILDMCDVSTKLIFVGDVDQLPSIGPGQVLRDLIESNAIAVARLSTIHRQAGDSHIITNAHAIIKGKRLEDKDKRDFSLAERESEEECLQTLKNYMAVSFPKFFGVNPMDIQILAPLRRGLLGVNNLNKEIQEMLNPPHPDKNELIIKSLDGDMVYREGDKVIQTKNNYNIICDTSEGERMGVFNGEVGIIVSIVDDDGDKNIFVDFGDDKRACYDSHSIRELELAYAITIHKSQGSEFDIVFLPLFAYGMPTIYNRNLLYTAVTRAKKSCCIIGQETTVNKMIRNTKVNKRRTTLSIRLNGESDECLKDLMKPAFNYQYITKKKSSSKKKVSKKEKEVEVPKEPKKRGRKKKEATTE